MKPLQSLIVPLAVAVAMSSATDRAAPAPPAGGFTAMTVNGSPVSLDLYTSLVRARQRQVEESGVHVSWRTARGIRRLSAIEAGVLRRLVGDVVVEQVAESRHVTVTETELDDAIAGLEKVVGGPAALDSQLQMEGFSRPEFRTFFRFGLFQTKLESADPLGYAAAVARAVQSASVQAYVGPCLTDHDYPRCAGGS